MSHRQREESSLPRLLQLTAASALGATAVVDAAAPARVWDIEARGLTVDNGGTLLPPYQAAPVGGSNQTTVVILTRAPGAFPKNCKRWRATSLEPATSRW